MYQLSIIIPVFNTEQYLPRCLDSLVSQHVDSLEIVVVSDASPGNCAEIVEQYRSSHPAVSFNYIEFTRNRGTFAARAAGYRGSGGRYLMGVDPDDWLGANTCNAVLRVIRKHNADIVEFPSFNCDSDGNTKLNSTWRRVPAKLYGQDILRALLNDQQVPPYVWGKLYRREVLLKSLENLHYFDNIRIVKSEDMLQTFSICMEANSCISTPKGAYYYFENPASGAAKIVLNEEKFKDGCRDIGLVRRGIVRLFSDKNIAADLYEKFVTGFMQPMAVLLDALRAQPAERFNRLYKYLFSSSDPALAAEALHDHEFPVFCETVAALKPISKSKASGVGFLSNNIGKEIIEFARSLPAAISKVNFFHDASSATANAPLHERGFNHQLLAAKRATRWNQLEAGIESNAIGVLIFFTPISLATLYDIGAAILNGVYCVIIESQPLVLPASSGEKASLALHACKLADVVVCCSEAGRNSLLANGIEHVRYDPRLLKRAEHLADIFVPAANECWEGLISDFAAGIKPTSPTAGNWPETQAYHEAMGGNLAPLPESSAAPQLQPPPLGPAKSSGVKNQPAIWLWFAPRYFWFTARLKALGRKARS